LPLNIVQKTTLTSGALAKMAKTHLASRSGREFPAILLPTRPSIDEVSFGQSS
jgi:hypothetical protein